MGVVLGRRYGRGEATVTARRVHSKNRAAVVIRSFCDLLHASLSVDLAFGKPGIRAKTPFPVNDLHRAMRPSPGLDASQRTVDNHRFAVHAPVQCGRCENKFST